MGIHDYDLKLMAYLQEQRCVELERCCAYQNKSLSSVKRSFAAVNEYLTPDRQIRLEDNHAVFQMSYAEYLDFLQALTLQDYQPSQEERVFTMAVYLFFNGVLNKTHLYETLRFSLSTKKNDSHALDAWMHRYGQRVVVVPKAGVQAQGEELTFRLCICDLLCRFLEVDERYTLVLRKANNPLQNMLGEYFLAKACEEIPQAGAAARQLQQTRHCRIAYRSLKFFLVYLSCGQLRARTGHPLQRCPALPLAVNNLALVNQPDENAFLNALAAALDVTPPGTPPADPTLLRITRTLVENVQQKILTRILDDHCIYEEVYAYLHKSTIRNLFHVSFYDNMLDETQEHYHFLYQVLREALQKYQQAYGVEVSAYQLSVLTLIFRKYVIKNKVAGRNRKRLVVVSNAPSEKIAFFIEKLRVRLDVALAGVVNINELYRIRELQPCDEVVVFSNRIATLLKESGYTCVKLHFYLTESDYVLLEERGFSTSHRKLKAETFLQELKTVPPDEQKNYLLQRYPEFFLE